MRVAFFVGAFPMASETFVVNAAKAVTGAGHALAIHALDPSIRGDAPIPPEVEAAGLTGLVVPSNPPLTPAARPRAIARALRALPRHGPRAARLLAPPPPGEARDAARALFDAEAVTPGTRYDVLHCHFATLAPRVQRLRAAGVLSGRLLVHCRGNDVAAELPRRPGVARRLFASADGVVANSEHFRQAAIRLGAREADSTVIPSGLDLSGFPYRDAPPPDGPLRLLTVGRLVEKKGIAYLLDALATLENATLDVLGDGPLRGDLEARTQRLGLAERVRFRGAVTHAEVGKAMRGADVFVACSVTAASGDQDAGTNTLKEAMATGLPVVATRHGGIPELVRDGTEGVLVPERDPPALAAAIRALAYDPGRWPVMGAAGRARVEAGFSQAASAAKLLAAYEALASGTPLSSLDRK